VPAEHRLSERNPTFRGNLLVPEGGRAGVAILNVNDGVVLQDLPFDVELKKFIVEYYDTGMPKLFASEIVIHDHATGAKTEATVKVNEPAFHRGIAIYQSSFDDGGSKLQLRALPMAAGGQPFNLEGTVGGSTELRTDNDQHKLKLEFTGLRVINVENMGSAGAADTSGADVRKVDLTSSLNKHLGSGVNPARRCCATSARRHLQAARRRRPGARVQQLHGAGGTGRPARAAGRRARKPEPSRSATCASRPTSRAAWTAGCGCAPRSATQAARPGGAPLRHAGQPPADKPEMAEQLRVTGVMALGCLRASSPHRGGTSGRERRPAGLSAVHRGRVPEADRSRISPRCCCASSTAACSS
jgi:cytochrome c biogenesis protein